MFSKMYLSHHNSKLCLIFFFLFLLLLIYTHLDPMSVNKTYNIFEILIIILNYCMKNKYVNMEENNIFIFLFTEKNKILEEQLNDNRFQSLKFMSKVLKTWIHVSSDKLKHDATFDDSFDDDKNRFKPLDYFEYGDKFLTYGLHEKIGEEIINNDIIADKYILTGCIGLSASDDLLFLCEIIPAEKYKYFNINFNTLSDQENEKLKNLLLMKNEEYKYLMKIISL